MCIPHAPHHAYKAEKREKKVKPKIPFNKKLLEPDLDFIDERKDSFIPRDKARTLLDKLFSLMH